ncbi:Scavenger receptor cysteine-rich type 1 M130, partial [Paramuricea clavata]
MVVAGDSILKHVEGLSLSNMSNHVVVESFSGATTSDMEDYLRPVLQKEPNKIILHI